MRGEVLVYPQGISHYVLKLVPLNQGPRPGLKVGPPITGLDLRGTGLCYILIPSDSHTPGRTQAGKAHKPEAYGASPTIINTSAMGVGMRCSPEGAGGMHQ